MMALLQNAVVYVVPFVLVITVVIAIHEFGHFLAGRMFGTAIDRFSIGFGRSIVSWTDRLGTEWRIAWLPLGGYVKYAGDDNVASVPDKADLETMRAEIVAREGPGAERKYLHFKPLWQRAVIVLAGPMANFALSIVIFSVLLGIIGDRVTEARVFSVVPGGAAAHAGFQAGDVLTRADDKPLRDFEDLQFYVRFRSGVPIDFTVVRGGHTLHLTATPVAVNVPAPGGTHIEGRLGLEARGGTRLQHYNPLEAVAMGATRTFEMVRTTLFYMGRIVTGQVGSDQLHGFIGIAHASGDVVKQTIADAQQEKVDWRLAAGLAMIQFVALISVSVGVLNLLPIPVLDGGHLLFYAYEAVARRPLSARVQAMGYRVGLALIVGLMLFAGWNDLQLPHLFRLFGSFS